MGGTTIQQPQQPQAPSVQSSMADYVANYPAMMALQQKYAPQEAALQVQLAQQYAQPLGEAYKTAQEAMYPGETAITNNLNQQVQEGMQSQVPDWMKQEYLSNLNANMGTNAGSPIAADYVSRGLLQQKQDYQNYYRNLGLSITGRQPVYQAQQPQTTNQLSSYTPQSVLGYNSNIYGTQAGMYNTQYQGYSNNANASPPWLNAVGSIGGSLAGGVSGGWANNFFKK